MAAVSLRVTKLTVEAVVFPVADVWVTQVVIETITQTPTTVSAPFIASSAGVFAPTVILARLVSGATIASGAVLHSPSVAPDLAASGATIASGAVVFPPTVIRPVMAATIVNVSVLHAPPLVAIGLPLITVPHITNTSQVFPPTVWTPGSLYLPRIESTARLFAPVIPQPIGNSVWMGDGSGGLWID